MTTQILKAATLSVLAAVSMAAWQTASAVPAWTVDSPSNFRNGSWSFGDIFTVGANDILVTELGAFDANVDGFVTAGGIEVGIFRESDDALLVSTFVTSTDTLIGNYRFADIADLVLSANTQYRVVATNRDDLYNTTSGTPDNVDPRITWNGYGYYSTTALVSCDAFAGTERTWMANFQLEDSTPVPEPASLAILGAGLIGLRLARRRAA